LVDGQIGQGKRRFPKRGVQRDGRVLRDRRRRAAARGGERGVIFTVAIDGPAAAGKGTIGRAVAREFGFAHLDTGLLYRAVGLQALEDGRGVIDPYWAAELARRLTPAALARDDLRSARAGQAASKVAALQPVRAALLAFQRDFARRDGGAVLDGRDIGTVICPEAEAKLFVTASDEIRATRRTRELAAADYAAVLAELRARDARDAGRDVAPLRAAADAHLLDTTDLSIDAAVAEAVAFVKSRFEPGGE
jgi:cytidylate kinase